MIRKLSEAEINSILKEKNINKTVVKDFLGTIHEHSSLLELVSKLNKIAIEKKLNPDTCSAMRKGISILMKK